jgi:pyrrolidone-carboxylate peptidase
MATRKPILLLTAYRPFQGRAVNGSATMLAWARRNKARWPHLEIRALLLPVTWAGAMARLRQAHTRLPLGHSIYLLGMGEGHPDRIAWELRAVNAGYGADELGQPGPGILDAAAPSELDSQWAPSFPDALHIPCPIVQSRNAGQFLCNRLLWENLRFLAQRKTATQPNGAAFMHLPPQHSETSRNYLRRLTPAVVHALMALRNGQ